MSKSNKIRVGISCGDINGIGMEVILKTLSDPRVMDNCIPIIYASKQVFDHYVTLLEMEAPSVRVLSDDGKLDQKKINLVNCWSEDIEIQPGTSTPTGGKFAFESLKMVTSEIASTNVDVMVTAPINKKNIQSEEFDFPGHTEYLADYANEENPLMILANGNLRVALVTGHVALSQVAGKLSVAGIRTKLEVLQKALQQDFAITRPRIAVLGLNPHNGDEGLMGEEESTIIAPAVKAAQEAGILAFGPYPADGLFGSPNLNKFDAVLAMYHDQGLAPFKALAFENGVNFTAGLPIVRTSPDHGVAYDIAGKNEASEASFREALFMACDIHKNRAEYRELTSNSLQVSKGRSEKS